jgi:drug/metabolite transporter (DMT)-like permease
VIIAFMAESAPRHDVRWFATAQIAFAAVGVGLARLAAWPFLGRGGAVFVAESRPLARTWAFLAAVLWMAVVATVVTFVVQTWAQARMTSTHAAILFALEPVFTAAFAALVLGERMSGRDWGGAALVLLGILVSELPRRR